MSRMVTGLFYEREEAERAVSALKAQGLPAESIFLEAEVAPPGQYGFQGNEIVEAEQERRYAGREAGVIIGLTVGCLSGIGFGTLGRAMSEWMRSVEPTSTGLAPLMASPVLAAVAGAAIGLFIGWLMGWIVDTTLTRLGAGPPLPAHETLVTVTTDDTKLDHVYAALFRAHARHLHVAQRAT